MCGATSHVWRDLPCGATSHVWRDLPCGATSHVWRDLWCPSLDALGLTDVARFGRKEPGVPNRYTMQT
jgi:hypothetical protein